MPKYLPVPCVLTNGSLHFAQVRDNGTVQDVLDALLLSPDVIAEALDGLDDGHGWAIQRVRAERNGRTWEEDELEGLGDGQCLSF
jgi:diaphanous 1